MSISSCEFTAGRGLLRLKLPREMDVRRQPITRPLSSCHITPGGCKLLGLRQGWRLNSTVAYHLVKHPGKIRAAMPALAPGTLNVCKLPNVGHRNLIIQPNEIFFFVILPLFHPSWAIINWNHLDLHTSRLSSYITDSSVFLIERPSGLCRQKSNCF